jgi:hypothetical protein
MDPTSSASHGEAHNMVELELVGSSEDGSMLVLADAGGDEFTVPLDGRLRAVVRGDRVRTGALETSMESAQAESALRPRDIQARIRAGEAPEAVAEIAQVPVDRVMGYAVPVMAERQHIAERAQRSAVRRKNAEGPGILLWDAVAERLHGAGVDPGSCRWDAWRRGDGRWTVTVAYHGEQGERTGRFVFDALSRYTVADDDEARRLVGEAALERGAERGQTSTGQRRTAGRRLSAVASEYDAMLFDDDEPTAELTAVADVLSADVPDDPRGDAAAGGDTDREEASAPQEHPQSAPRLDEAEGVAARVVSDEGSPPRKPTRQQPRPEKRGRRGRGRASVPSWDEIMFGGQPKG